MRTTSNQTTENKSTTKPVSVNRKLNSIVSTVDFEANNSDAVLQRRIIDVLSNDAEGKRLSSVQQMIDNSEQVKYMTQLQGTAKKHTEQHINYDHLQTNIQKQPFFENSSPIQRIIERSKGNPYKSAVLRSNSDVLIGADPQQIEFLQQLHQDRTKTYSINEARQLVGLAPLAQDESGPKAPFGAMRWDMDPSAAPHMQVVDSDSGGFIAQSGQSGFEDEPMISMSIGLGASELQHGSVRDRDQVATTGLSPNLAAQSAGLPPGPYEWLHLVAFSIGETHVGQISAESRAWLEKSDQAQQITENMVLGSKAANTAMIEFESFIKQTMKADPSLRLNLVVYADVQQDVCQNKVFNWARSIRYHFNFVMPNNSLSPPFLADFNTLDPKAPPIREFEEMMGKLKQQLTFFSISSPSIGPSTTGMEKVSSGY